MPSYKYGKYRFFLSADSNERYVLTETCEWNELPIEIRDVIELWEDNNIDIELDDFLVKVLGDPQLTSNTGETKNNG
jgi:hypothetical protein